MEILLKCMHRVGELEDKNINSKFEETFSECVINFIFWPLEF